MSKGLFVPLSSEHEELKVAIEQGAIAAVWPKDVHVRRYVPNHFPIFFADSSIYALEEIIETYIQSYRQENKNMTAIYFELENIHNNKATTYDREIMNILQQLENYLHDAQKTEGGEQSC